MRSARNPRGQPSLVRNTAPLGDDSPHRSPASTESESARQMRVFSGHLRRHADLIDYFASVQAAMGNPPLKILSGNFYMGLRGIGDFLRSQLFGRVLRVIKRPTREQTDIIAEAMKQLQKLEEEMPPPRGRRKRQ